MNNEETFKAGEICFCYYPKIIGEHELELYYCKILSIGKEYAKCKLYFGGYLNKLYGVKGIFNDVCVADLSKLGKGENPAKNNMAECDLKKFTDKILNAK